MRKRIRQWMCGVCLVPGIVLAQGAPPPVEVATLPAQPKVERLRDAQQINFDLVFSNPGTETLTLVGLEATLRDPRGRFFSQRRLDRNGDDTTMSIATIANRELGPGGRLVVFNPFARFGGDVWLGDLRYEAVFQVGKDGPERKVALDVSPRPFQPATRLRLPLDGESFVHDGHDLLAHHRRLDITGGMTTHFGIRANFMRYAHDFVVTDAQGRLFRGDGARPEDWYGYGQPVQATGDGVVRETHDGMADNRKGGPPPFTEAEIMKNLKLFLGNYVLLDHGNGEFSVFAHLRQGSVAVKPGQAVKAGAPIGAMGMSGDAFLVHLHYQLQSGPAFEEGLPAYFADVQVDNGQGWSAPFTGGIDTGDRVRAAEASP